MYQAWKRQEIYTTFPLENMMERHERGTQRCKNYMRMDLKGTDCEVIDCVYPAEERIRWWAFVNTVMNLQVP